MDALRGVPSEMRPWGLRLDQPYPSEFGEYAVVEISPATIETHHQVELIDEAGLPLRGVPVIFGFPGGDGPAIDLTPTENYWRDAPARMTGNLQRSNYAGYAQHTFASGGEDIWIWDIDAEGVLRLPSAIVRNCTWVNTGVPGANFNHTGVRIVFQRRKAGVEVKSVTERLSDLEARVAELEAIG